MSSKPQLMTPDQFPTQITEKLRYGDTDRQGHINNAVYSTLCESGRVGFLYDPKQPFLQPGAQYVIAQLKINFIEEMNWPGDVIIGTGVTKVGRSSVCLLQGIFLNGICMATSENVLVLMDEKTRKSTPLFEETIDALKALNLINITL